MKQSYDLGAKSIQANNFVRFPELRNTSPDQTGQQLNQTVKTSYLADKMTPNASFSAIPIKQVTKETKQRTITRLSKSKNITTSKTVVVEGYDDLMTMDDGALPGLATARMALQE